MKSINHKVHEGITKNTKLNLWISALCDLCVPDNYRDL